MNELEDHSLTPAKAAWTPPVRTITQLKDLNLEDALLEQYYNAQELLSEVLTDADVPPNQKAQCINSITSILGSITRSQEALYNAERVKKLEIALTTALKTLPKETQDQFFTLYEAALGAE